MGFHNVDLSWNFRSGIDCNSFNCMDLSQRYSLGIDGMMVSFLMICSEVVYFYSNFIKNVA